VPAIFAAVQSGQGYEGTDEYCTRGGDQYDLPPGAPLVALLPAGAGEGSEGPYAPQALASGRILMEAWKPERKAFTVDAPQPVRAAVQLLNYPAWQVSLNNRPAGANSDPDTGQMLVPLPAGRSRVEVSFARTPDRMAGGALSGLAALVIAGLAIIERRARRRSNYRRSAEAWRTSWPATM
jgi:hypothetical protein